MKKKKIKNSSSPSHNTDLQSPDFHQAIAKTAVAQICQSTGYRGAQTSALETLTDVSTRYLQSLAMSAATSAGSTGRTQCNLLDIIRALEDFHTDIGFHGNSEPKSRLNSLTDSSLLRDIMKFVYRTREIPFSKPLPRRNRRRTLPPDPPRFSDENVKLNHTPLWLPDFPNREKPVVAAENDGAIASEKRIRSIKKSSEISKLPENPNRNIGGEKPVVAAASDGEIASNKTIRSTKPTSEIHKLPENPNPPRFSGENPKFNHIPPWLPDFPNLAVKTPVVAAAAAASDGEISSPKMIHPTKTSSKISKLPEKRKKVSFKIGGDGNSEIESRFGSGSDLRILMQIHDDDEKLSNATSSNNNNHGDKSSMKKKLEEPGSRTRMIMMH